MSRCTLSVELEPRSTPWKGGETLRGVVIAEVNQDVRCEGLHVTLGWRAHGRGNREEEEDQSAMVFRGAWTAGRRYRYPFTMTLPPSPVSYRGTVLSLGWWVRARAELPWAIDPKAETDLELVRGAEAPVPKAPPYAELQPALSLLSQGQGLIVAGMSGCMGTAMLGVSAAMVAMGELGALLFVAVSLGMLAYGASKARAPVRALRSANRFSDITLTAEPMCLRAGEPCTLTISLTPKQSLQLEEASVELAYLESATSGSGTNTTTHRHREAVQTFPLEAPAAMPAGEALTRTLTVTLPADLAPTLWAQSNRLSWMLRLRARISGTTLERDTLIVVV